MSVQTGYYNSKRIDNFEQNIKNLIIEIEQFKAQYPTLWVSDYDNILHELKDISDLIIYNPIDANTCYTELPLAKYDTFQSYVYNTNAKAITLLKCNTERTKTLRAKRRNITCPLCGNKLNNLDGTLQCESCDYIQEGKLASQSTRTMSNNTKHICKQLDALTGARKAPTNIAKIVDYITLWLTEPKYIAEWLKSKDLNPLEEYEKANGIESVSVEPVNVPKGKGRKKNVKKTSNSSGSSSFDKWVKKYNEYTEEYITDSFFNKSIQRVPANVPDYNVFKLFMDEFYALLEHCHRCALEKASNMDVLSLEDQYNIFKQYAVENKYRLPVIFEKYVYKGVEYEIGLRFNSLSLLANNDIVKATVVSETLKDETLIVGEEEMDKSFSKSIELKRMLDILFKNTLNAMRRSSITIPGLMFNYKDVYNKSESPPKKYCYQQEYCWLMNRAFNTPFVHMPKQDKDDIIKIILKFNDFYKDRVCKQDDKICNSPLYCCTIVCVLNLAYFQKYKHALKFVPVKDNSTIAFIRKAFFEFEIQYTDFLKPFKNANRVVNDDVEEHEVKEIVVKKRRGKKTEEEKEKERLEKEARKLEREKERERKKLEKEAAKNAEKKNKPKKTCTRTRKGKKEEVVEEKVEEKVVENKIKSEEEDDVEYGVNIINTLEDSEIEHDVIEFNTRRYNNNEYDENDDEYNEDGDENEDDLYIDDRFENEDNENNYNNEQDSDSEINFNDNFF